MTLSMGGISGTASTKSQNFRKKNKSNIYLQYIIQFVSVNKRNFSADSLGGLNYKEISWAIEQETF